MNQLHMKTNRLFCLLLLTGFCLCNLPADARKKPLDHSVYDGWQSISSPKVPYGSRYLFYYVNVQEGDNTLYIKDLKDGDLISVPRGASSAIRRKGDKAICSIRPFFKETREAKIARKKAYEMPKDTLAVIDLNSGEITRYPGISSFRYGDDLDRFVVIKAAATKHSAKKGSELFLLDLESMKMDTLRNVDHYRMSDNGERLVYSTLPEDSTDLHAMHVLHLATQERKTLLSSEKDLRFSLPFMNEDGTEIAFLAQPDTSSAVKEFRDVYYADLKNRETAVPILTNRTEGIPEGLSITAFSSVIFREDGSGLILGLNETPAEDKDKDIPSFEKVKMSVWVWNSDYLPPKEEMLKKGRTAHKAYPALYHFNRPGHVIPLADRKLPDVILPKDYEGDLLLTLTDKPYRIEQQWGEGKQDLYEINLCTGERKKIREAVNYSRLKTSPDGNHAVWFDAADTSWHLYNLLTKAERNLTAGLPALFWNDEKDTPSAPSPFGNATWLSDGSAFFLPSKHDIWKFDPTGAAAPQNFTENLGEENSVRFTILTSLDYNSGQKTRSGAVADQNLSPDAPVFFSSFNLKTRETGLYMKNRSGRKELMIRLVEGPHTYKALAMINSYSYPGTKKSRRLSTPQLVYQKGDFCHSNDLYITRDRFQTEEQLTAINPQQAGYNWGTVEMVRWQTADGIDAEGLLYKPEDFDPARKYPMLVYFYEKESDKLYQYKEPAPSRSIINIPYCVSNGYLVFVPDIYYETGHPGQSAMRSIMPGIDMLCKNSWVDEDRMALQGQSWGGYQTAYMITQTDRFAAAGAGAPVSNMTSAYGGIRWGSGISRQGQYEHGQSRIGKNLWEGHELYIENSPVFFVPQVTTPVLIMHNDADGAVPWYQGIEFFTTLRRCGKQAWMVQYKDEAHNLVLRHNCKDYSVKLMEFFDHFLKDAPMPDWMKKH